MASASPGSLKGQSPNVPAGEVKLTPEQEANKQRAIQQGPSIKAANDMRGGMESGFTTSNPALI